MASTLMASVSVDYADSVEFNEVHDVCLEGRDSRADPMAEKRIHSAIGAER